MASRCQQSRSHSDWRFVDPQQRALSSATKPCIALKIAWGHIDMIYMPLQSILFIEQYLSSQIEEVQSLSICTVMSVNKGRLFAVFARRYQAPLAAIFISPAPLLFSIQFSYTLFTQLTARLTIYALSTAIHKAQLHNCRLIDSLSQWVRQNRRREIGLRGRVCFPIHLI